MQYSLVTAYNLFCTASSQPFQIQAILGTFHVKSTPLLTFPQLPSKCVRVTNMTEDARRILLEKFADWTLCSWILHLWPLAGLALLHVHWCDCPRMSPGRNSKIDTSVSASVQHRQIFNHKIGVGVDDVPVTGCKCGVFCCSRQVTVWFPPQHNKTQPWEDISDVGSLADALPLHSL